MNSENLEAIFIYMFEEGIRDFCMAEHKPKSFYTFFSPSSGRL
jgi:hypothetical protein